MTIARKTITTTAAPTPAPIVDAAMVEGSAAVELAWPSGMGIVGVGSKEEGDGDMFNVAVEVSWEDVEEKYGVVVVSHSNDEMS